MRLFFVISVILVFAGSFAPPAVAEDRMSCKAGDGAKPSHDLTAEEVGAEVAACDRLIAAGTLQDKDLSRIYWLRGLALAVKKEHDRAIADYDQAIRLDPKAVVAFKDRGVSYHQKGQDDRAIADYDQAIRLDPKYANPFNNRGNIWKARGDNERALADYNEAIRLNQSIPSIFVNRGNTYKDKGEYDRAIADFDQAIRLNPNYAPVFNSRGNTWKAKGNNERAIADYNEAIRLDPNYALAFNNRANAYKDRGEHDRAIADYDQAIRLKPKYALAFTNRASAWRAKGNNERAIADYNEAIRLDPKDSVAFNNRGIAYWYKNEPDRAIADYDQAIRLNPNYATALKNRAIAHSKNGQHDRALADYRAALALCADEPCRETLKTSVARTEKLAEVGGGGNRAMCRTGEGAKPARDLKAEEAGIEIAACDRLIASGTFKGKDLSRLYWLRALAFGQRNEHERALTDLNLAIRIDPENDDAYFTRGFYKKNRGDLAGAATDFGETIRLHPTFIAARRFRGEIHESMGQSVQALALYREGLSLCANDFCRRTFTPLVEKLEKTGGRQIPKQLATAQAASPASPGGGNAELRVAIGDTIERARAAYNITTDTIPVTTSGGVALKAPRDGLMLFFSKNEQALYNIRADAPFAGNMHGVRIGDSFDEVVTKVGRPVGDPWDYGDNKAYIFKDGPIMFRCDFNKARKVETMFQFTSTTATPQSALRQPPQRLVRPSSAAPVAAPAQAALQPAPQVAIQTPVAAVPSVTTSERRIALVIGNGRYANATVLPNPVNDAQAVAKALQEIGFEVLQGTDLDRTGMERLIRDFLRGAESARVALLFYSGHGMQVDGKNYLIPVEAKLASPSQLGFETVEVDKMLDALNDPARTNIIILDACRDNPLARSFASRLGPTRSAAVGAGLAAYSMLGTGTLIAYATAPGSVALDGMGRNSPFTTALIKHIRVPGLEVRRMLTRVRQEVASITANKQIPWDNSSLLGDVYLAGSEKP